jgi:hypothetical protein
MIHGTVSSPSVPLHQLVEAALQSMKGLGYSPVYRLCRGVWQDFLQLRYASRTAAGTQRATGGTTTAMKRLQHFRHDPSIHVRQAKVSPSVPVREPLMV